MIWSGAMVYTDVGRLLTINTTCDKLTERRNILLNAGLLERFHILFASINGNNRPRIMASCHHNVHEKTANSAITIRVRTDIYKKEMTQNNFNPNIFFLT
jgi:hypothetical protein